MHVNPFQNVATINYNQSKQPRLFVVCIPRYLVSFVHSNRIVPTKEAKNLFSGAACMQKMYVNQSWSLTMLSYDQSE